MGSWVLLSLTCFVPKDTSLPSLFLPAGPYHRAHNVSLFPQCRVCFAPTWLSLGIAVAALLPGWGRAQPFCCCTEQLQKHLHQQNSLLEGVSSKLN